MYNWTVFLLKHIHNQVAHQVTYYKGLYVHGSSLNWGGAFMSPHQKISTKMLCMYVFCHTLSNVSVLDISLMSSFAIS